MSKVGQKNTKPELALREVLHRLGYHYRLHRGDLPGKPDLVFPARPRVIFVHGCFWHGHGCRWGQLPKSRPEYWKPKIETNRERDKKVWADDPRWKTSQGRSREGLGDAMGKVR